MILPQLYNSLTFQYLKLSVPDVFFNSTPPMPDVYFSKPLPMKKVTVPKSFGDVDTIFVIEGRLPEESPESERDFPTVTFTDQKGRVALKVIVDVKSDEVVLSNNLHVSQV